MAKQYSILAIDIGGTGLKAACIDRDGNLLADRLRVPTPYPCPPNVMIDALVSLCEPLSGYERIAIGFPGVVRNGHILTAPHFKDPAWTNFPLAQAVSHALSGHPTRLVNDAEMQGLAAIEGKDLELVLTLGTGAGTALFREGDLMPHLELAHHPIRGKKSYNDYIGDAARKKVGKRRWNKRVQRTIAILESLLHFDHLYIGGGNAERLDFDLPSSITTISNDAGLEGGAALWKLDPEDHEDPNSTTGRAKPSSGRSVKSAQGVKPTAKNNVKSGAKNSVKKTPSSRR